MFNILELLKMSKWDKIAEQAYVAYCLAVDNKAFNGDDLPAWQDVGERIQLAWIAAIKRAMDCNVPDQQLSARDYIQSKTARD